MIIIIILQDMRVPQEKLKLFVISNELLSHKDKKRKEEEEKEKPVRLLERHLVSRTNGTILPNIFNHSSFLLKAIHCPDSTQ